MSICRTISAATVTTSISTITKGAEPDFELSKEIMTIKARLLALVNRLEHV